MKIQMLEECIHPWQIVVNCTATSFCFCDCKNLPRRRKTRAFTRIGIWWTAFDQQGIQHTFDQQGIQLTFGSGWQWWAMLAWHECGLMEGLRNRTGRGSPVPLLYPCGTPLLYEELPCRASCRSLDRIIQNGAGQCCPQDLGATSPAWQAHYSAGNGRLVPKSSHLIHDCRHFSGSILSQEGLTRFWHFWVLRDLGLSALRDVKLAALQHLAHCIGCGLRTCNIRGHGGSVCQETQQSHAQLVGRELRPGCKVTLQLCTLVVSQPGTVIEGKQCICQSVGVRSWQLWCRNSVGAQRQRSEGRKGRSHACQLTMHQAECVAGNDK
mmetsp:Transcript_157099/g.277419  ORF Transcript_157099/g.277419 Transcript_157099/m.277419 type:complete len:324 (+) Transcript_157099:545-1516(+)